MPQGGRPAFKKKTAATLCASKQQAEASGPAWQRSSGGFSGSAKKEYLKWKRQQKASRADDDSDGQDPPVQPILQDKQKPQSELPEAAAGQQQKKLHAPLASASNDDVAQPLHYRPLAAVPAAPFTISGDTLSRSAAASPAVQDHASTERCIEQPLASSDQAVTYMPRLDPAEVGFTPEGFLLDMPTRPQWQGRVSSAEELHSLEEAEFAAWQAALAHKAQQLSARTDDTTGSNHAAASTGAAAGAAVPAEQVPGAEQQQQEGQLTQGLAAGPGPVSCYEGRLEFWRQLWRTLEMSDIICMIVDARNPLLHFSHALYRHITQDHQLPLVLLLNKCDLIPAAAAAAWQQWLQEQLPGVTVIPVSAAKDQAAESARQVLSALLQQHVLRDGQDCSVQQLVGLSLDELIQESLQRNTHAKRHIEALQQQQQQQQQGERQCDTAAAAACSDEDNWSTKPSRGARKAARRSGRQKQQRQAVRAAPSQTKDTHGSASDSLWEETDATSATDSDTTDLAAGDTGATADIDDALAGLTLERRLSSTTAAGAGAHAQPVATAADAAAEGSNRQHQLRAVVVGMLGEPNVGKSSTLNALLGSHRVAVSSHPGRTKHYQTHYMCDTLVLVDCPGIAFPRLNVSPAMQVLFGSSPIASCRQPYAVVRYLAEASWPRVQDTLRLHTQLEQQLQQLQHADQHEQHGTAGACASAKSSSDGGIGSSDVTAALLAGGTDSRWSPWLLCEALAAKRHWVLQRSGRLDTYRAANWLLRGALAGQHGLGLAFMPPRTDA